MNLTADPILVNLLLLLDLLVAGSAIVWVLRHPREPRAMLAWILAFLLMPFLGVLLFLFIGEPRLRRLQRRRRRRRAALGRGTHNGSGRRLTESLGEPMDEVAHLVTRLTRRELLGGNRIQLLFDGQAALAALETALRGATHHIHLEYYLFRDDRAGRRIAEVLAERAKAGVECRLLVDFIGSWGLSRRFFRGLKANGVEVAFFLPVLPWRGRWRMNFRNHRKIAVIDGRIGFTGSQNIGDEYAGLDPSFGVWRDTHLRVEGPVAQDLQEIFAEDWHYGTRLHLAGNAYFPRLEAEEGSLAQLLPSGPDLGVRVAQVTLHTLFAVAQREICIATPYFVPDEALLLALQSAAYRGVRVKLLLPEKGDHRLTAWAARSYYRDLCAAGVELCEYRLGMLHSKVVIVDGRCAVVGSANMDERSFRLNFEVSLLIYDEPLAAQLLEDFRGLRALSRIYTDASELRWSFGQSLLLGVARLAAPLL